MNNSIKTFKDLSQQDKFKGWPVIGEVIQGEKIPYFGHPINYNLQTGNGVESYTSLIRQFGWAVAFGLTKDNKVITLGQWKPGVNRISWELPPGGIGKVVTEIPAEEVLSRTEAAYLKETGYGNGEWSYLGKIDIETGKYRGTTPDDHGLPAHLFLVTGLEKIQDSRNPNPNEIMETIMVPLDEFPAVLESGLFLEESAVACAYKALLKLGKLKWS